MVLRALKEEVGPIMRAAAMGATRRLPVTAMKEDMMMCGCVCVCV